MSEISPSFAVAILLVWPALIGFSMWKYVRAFKANKRLDAWIWFFVWGMCLTAIEWWVLSVMIVLQTLD